MADSLQLKVVTPKGCVVDSEVQACTATSIQGELCVLPGHCLLLSQLVAGRMMIKSENGEEIFAVDQGFLEAAPNRVNIITDQCMSASEIDVDHALLEISDLEKELKDKDAESAEGQLITRQLDWAKTRLRIAK